MYDFYTLVRASMELVAKN